MADIKETLAAASAATSGDNTPAGVTASQPTKESVQSVLAAMAMAQISALVVTIGLMAHEWPETQKGSVIMWLGILGVVAQICVPIAVIAIASSRLGSVKVAAGDKSFDIQGRK